MFDRERALCRQKAGARLVTAWKVTFGGGYVALMLVVVGLVGRTARLDDPLESPRAEVVAS